MTRKECCMFAAVVALVAALVVPAHADEEADIAELTKAYRVLDEAFSTGDAETIKSMMTSDQIAVTSYYGRPMNIDDALAALPEFNLEAYDYADVSIELLAPDVGIVTYTNLYKGTYAGEPGPEKVFATEIWQKRDGVWKQSLYQETPIK